LLPLDFGEAGEEKRVVLVDATPGAPATVRSVPLRAGRPLVGASGTWEELLARDDLTDAYVDLTVSTDGPDPGLAERAREAFPFLVKVRAEYERPDTARSARADLTLPELYTEFHQAEHGAPPQDEVAAAFTDIMEEVFGAPA
jgi:exonuclease SbcD